MPWSSETSAKFREALAPFLSACPICKGEIFSPIVNYQIVLSAPETQISLGSNSPAKATPMLAVSCNTCQHMMFFNTSILDD